MILQRSINLKHLYRERFFSHQLDAGIVIIHLCSTETLFFHVFICLVSYIFVSKVVAEVKSSGLTDTLIV